MRARFAMRLVAISLLLLVFGLAIMAPRTASAAEDINRTLNFQGRLLKASGGVVPDGHYNIQFKIYQGGSGTAPNNPDGTLKWTETYVNNEDENGIEVTNGIISVNLGSKTPFGSNVDWNQDTLFLSINVAGSALQCTSFGSGVCEADGEMLPMKRLTATPYAMNAGAVNGKTAANFVQLAQGVQNDSSVGTSSIFINKTGTGNLIQLQDTSTDVFTVSKIGDLTFGSSNDHTLSIAESTAGNEGRQLTLKAGTGGSGTGNSGGNLVIQGGNAGGVNADGGNISIDSGSGTGTGTDGYIAIGTNHGSNILIGSTYRDIEQTILIGHNDTAGGVANVFIGAGSNASSGVTMIQSKDDTTIATNGVIRATFDTNSNLTLGNGAISAAPTNFTVQGTASSSSGVNGGSLVIQGGNATVGDANGGDITISGGAGVGSGVSGLVILNTPTFTTVTDDVNCYTDGATVALSCTLSASTVNNASAAVIGFSTSNQAAILPDPVNKTAGRIFYVMAGATSQEFTLRANIGAGIGIEQQLTIKPSTTMPLLWNGNDWIPANSQQSSFDDGNASKANLFKLDTSNTAPTGSSASLVGSMYYDSESGKIQCYEADGWGSCGASPDNFVTLSPEYSNAIVNGTDVGTLSSDLCSDTLDINDGSSAQPTICGANETHNYYNWTSTESTDKSRNIYISYQLPNSFKEFVPDSTSLLGRTDSSAARVSYQLYRDDNTNGLVACGEPVNVSSGVQTSWQKAVSTETNDPANCGFEAGNKLIVRIILTSKDSAHAYVSDLNFAYSHK
jgi:hypothetical protein